MLEELKNYTGEDRLVSSKDMAEALKNQPEVPRFKYGISNIDFLTGGFESGEVIIITGWSGFGKTTFCQTMLTNFSNQGMPILSISYEGKLSQFFRRLSNPLPNFYLPRKNRSYDLDWLKQRISEGVSKHGIKVALLDHLGFIIPPPRGDHFDTYAYTLKVGALIREVKALAMDYDITIFLVCHCGKPPKNKDGKPPPMPQKGDLKDSSGIEQDSDAVYVIHRVYEKLKGVRGEAAYAAIDKTQFQIMKQRENGNMGKVALLTYHNGALIPAMSQAEEKAFVS